MGDFNYLKYFYTERLNFDTDPPVFRVFYILSHSVPAAALLFLAACAAALWFSSLERKGLKFAGFVLLGFALLACKIEVLKDIGDRLEQEPPPVSIAQVKRVLDSRETGSGKLRLSAATGLFQITRLSKTRC